MLRRRCTDIGLLTHVRPRAVFFAQELVNDCFVGYQILRGMFHRAVFPELPSEVLQQIRHFDSGQGSLFTLVASLAARAFNRLFEFPDRGWVALTPAATDRSAVDSDRH